MMTAVSTERKDKIIECHNKVHGSMKAALEYALEAGKLLTEVKEELNHGEFIPWLKENMPFAERTARNYMKVHEYRYKTASVADLQEAYRQIETIEQQEKKRKQEENRNKIRQYQETGEKPETWDRSTEYQFKKEDDDKAYEERKQAAFEREDTKFTSQDVDDLLNQSRVFQESLGKTEHLNLSSYADTVNQQDMFSAIERYLNTFDATSQKLEAAHNLIKKLKLIVNDLQRESVG